MKLLLISISALMICMLTDGCYIKLAKESHAVHPLMQFAQGEEERPGMWWGRKEDGECMFYRRIKPRYSLKLTLESSNLNGYVMKVYGNKRQKPAAWEEKGVLQEGDENTIWLTGYKAVKIIARNDTEFQINYDLALCQVPSSVEESLCTNKHRRSSTCLFDCNQPLYTSIEPFAGRFPATCRRNRKWTVDFSTKCVSVEQVKDLCLTIKEEDIDDIEDTKPDGCNFTEAQLAYFFPENSMLGHTSDEMFNIVLDFAREKYLGIYVGIAEDGDGSRSGGGGICLEYCLRNQEGKYHLSCDEQEGWKPKKICYACRYKYKICERHNIIA